MRYLYYILIGIGVLNTIPVCCASHLPRELFSKSQLYKLAYEIERTPLEDKAFEELFKIYDHLTFEQRYRICKMDSLTKEKLAKYEELQIARIEKRLLFEKLNALCYEWDTGKTVLNLEINRFVKIRSINSCVEFIKLYTEIKDDKLLKEEDVKYFVGNFKYWYESCGDFIAELNKIAQKLDNFDRQEGETLVKLMNKAKSFFNVRRRTSPDNLLVN